MEILNALKHHIGVALMKNQDGSCLKDDQLLIQQGIIDSLGILSLLNFIEDKYSVQIADEELTPENFETPLAISKLIQDKLTHRSRAQWTSH